MEIAPSFEKLLHENRVALLLTKPRCVLTAFEFDFEKFKDDFTVFCRSNPNTLILLQIGFEHETPEPAAHLGKLVTEFLASADGKPQIIVLCNNENENQTIHAHGADTRFINQNVFLDERRYRPFYGKRPFDAAYIARLTPFKRHGLLPTELAPKLLLLGANVRKEEQDYAETIHQKYAKSTWIPFFSGARISEYLAKAKCGLALSASEGACFASAEYFLCGLPLVNTPALGGRDILFPNDFVKNVEANPEAIAEGIAFWVANPPDPDKIRAAWLDKAKPHREAFHKLMRELTGRTFPIPHKLGIRTPHPGRVYSLVIQCYLMFRSLTSRL